MTRKAWAAGFLALLTAAGVMLLVFHWQDGETRTFVQAAVKPEASTAPYGWPSGAVNVNTAGLEELQMLNGINRSQIQALLDDRALRGPFDFPEDLIYVKGIGEKTLEKIYDQLDFSWRDTGQSAAD